MNPDGQAATYTFELGRYTGAGTQFGIVFSGPAGAGRVPVGESLGLSGLQPGTTYAYRVAVHSGDGSAQGETATGAMLTFTTEGLPAVLSVVSPLTQLAIPNIAFPTAAKGSRVAKKATPRCKQGQKLNHGKCTKPKPKTKKKVSKKARKTSRSRIADHRI